VHGHGIDQLMLDLHVGKFLARHARGHVAPQSRGFQHVGLVHRGELAASRARELAGATHDAFHFDHAVAAQVAGVIRAALLVAEIDAAGQLAHDQQVHAGEQMRLDRCRAKCGRMRCHRTQVGVKAQCLAQGEQALFRAHAGVRVRPLRPAHRTQQYGIGVLAGVQRLLRQRRAAGINGGAANQVMLEVEAMAEVACHRSQHVNGGCGDFRTNAVTGQDNDFSMHGAIPHGG
jgi:hypothetical protein